LAKFGIVDGSKEWMSETLVLSSGSERTLGSFSNKANLSLSGVFDLGRSANPENDFSLPSLRSRPTRI